MRIAIASSLAAYAATVAGLLVTSPVKGEKVDLSKPVTIEWQSVSTDPKTFSIYLVNQNAYPNVETLIASDVDTSKGHYTMKAQDSTEKSGYQINFVSNGNDGILAQSQQFTVGRSKLSGAVSSNSVTSTTSTTTTTHTNHMTTSSMTEMTMSTGTMTASGSATTITTTTTTNGANSLMVRAQAGLLLGLAALAL